MASIQLAQVAEDGRFMKESDIWSFGTMLYLMWGTGHKPHETLETTYNEVSQELSLHQFTCVFNLHCQQMLYSGNSLNKNVIPEIPNSLPIINKIVKECW